MGNICAAGYGLRPALLMVVVQVATAATNVLYIMAANDGMSLRILIAYRFLFASAFVVPLALYVERKQRPKMTWIVVGQAFLCGLGASLAQNLYAQSLALTSATFASAMSNLVPVITFLFAIIFGLETLGLGAIAGKAKVVGTIVSIGGAVVLSLYKGPEINLWSTHIDLLHESATAKTNDHILGSLFAITSCFSSALSLILQAKMSERYPRHYSTTALIAVMGSVQAVVYALCSDTNWKQWNLVWDIRLLSVAYSGIVASGVMVIIVMWCIHMRGPLFVSVFGPLMPVLTAIAGSLTLNEKLHLGSVLGAILIVCGLYMVLWGKGKEITRTSKLMPSKTPPRHSNDQPVEDSVEVDITLNSLFLQHKIVLNQDEITKEVI